MIFNEKQKIMKQEITITPNQIELEKQFEYVNSIIEQHHSSAIAKVNTTN